VTDTSDTRPQAPYTWAQSVASTGTGDTASIEIDINLPGVLGPVPVEVPLDEAVTLHAMLGGVLAEHARPQDDGGPEEQQTPCGLPAHGGYCDDPRTPGGTMCAYHERSAHEEHRQQLAAALGEGDTEWGYILNRAAEIREGRDRADDTSTRLSREVTSLREGIGQLRAEGEQVRTAVCDALGGNLVDWPEAISRVRKGIADRDGQRAEVRRLRSSDAEHHRQLADALGEAPRRDWEYLLRSAGASRAEAVQRATVLHDARDALGTAGHAPDADDWPAVAPAIRKLTAEIALIRGNDEVNRREASNRREALAKTLRRGPGADWYAIHAAAAEAVRRAETASQEARDARQGETVAVRARKAAEARVRGAEQAQDDWRTTTDRQAAVLRRAEAALARVREQCADWLKPILSSTPDGRLRDEVARTCADIIERAARTDGPGDIPEPHVDWRDIAAQREEALGRVRALRDRWTNALGGDRLYARALDAVLNDYQQAETCPGLGPHLDAARELVAAALRAAARNCFGNCGLSEVDCARTHRVQVDRWTPHGVVSEVHGPIDALADVVAAVVQPSLDELADYRNRISWETTCGSCARALDAAYEQTARDEMAEPPEPAEVTLPGALVAALRAALGEAR
jgi:hypothetical protein